MKTLSYVWDTGIRDRVLISSEGCALYATENLERAVSEVSMHCSTGYIWIDQIWIDQDNVIERNEQVQNIGLIYGILF